MKLLANFRLCCGGSTVAPAAETTNVVRRQEAAAPLIKQASSRRSQWRPSLSVISEESVVVSNNGSGRIKLMESDGSRRKRGSRKSRSSVTAMTYSDGEHHSKNVLSMSLQALAPMPYLF